METTDYWFSLRSHVSNISVVPSGDHYTVEVQFAQGLNTTYGIELAFSSEMQAQAEIVTEDLRLLERLFMPIKKIFGQQKH